MHIMKSYIFKIILLIAVAINLSFVLIKASNKNNYVLSAGKGEYFTVGSNRYLLVPVELTNNTNDTVKYIVTLCPKNDCYWFKSKMLDSACGRCCHRTTWRVYFIYRK